VYVVCEPCRRYVGVGGWLDNLDSRLVTFGCTVCGRPGRLTFDDPTKEGLQQDLRANPPRHPEVAARLAHMQHLANPFGRRPSVIRGLLPQSEPTKFVPEPRYRLKPMPFATFGELEPLGLVLEVWGSTYKSSRPVVVGESLAARPLRPRALHLQSAALWRGLRRSRPSAHCALCNRSTRTWLSSR
jgi:hypothetical protein